MNIFVTDENPLKSANNLDSKRVNKMLLESTQMLCTAVNLCGGDTPYKSTHINHPCNVWARKSRENWFWLLRHASKLSINYTLTTNKVHKCQGILDDLLLTKAYDKIPSGELTSFINCARNISKGVDYSEISPVTEAYRRYLDDRWNTDKLKPSWKHGNKPEWSKYE